MRALLFYLCALGSSLDAAVRLTCVHFFLCSRFDFSFASYVSVTKLAGLLVKTLAKPMAKRIKHDFSRFPITRRLLVNVGQTTHTVTSRLTIWSAGYKVRSITPLESEKAISKGADFLGEAIVFSVGGGVVVWEYNLSKSKEKEKEKKRLREMDNDRERLQAKLNTLDTRLAALEKVMKANSRPLVLFGGGAKYVEPDHVVPIDDGESSVSSAEGDGSAAEHASTAKHHQPIDIRGLIGDMERGIGDPGEAWSSDTSTQRSEEISGEEKNPAPVRRIGWWGWWPF